MQRLIYQDLWAEGVRCEHAVEGPLYMPQGVNATPHGPQAQEPALLRPGEGPHRRRPDRGDERDRPPFEDTDPFQGVSVTFGSADLLVELAGDSLDAVRGPVLDVIRGTPGVVWTKTLFIYSEPWRARP